MATSEERIISIINQYYPELDAGPGTPFYEYVVRPMAFLWASHDLAANEFLAARDMSNYSTMDEEDLDRLMSKFFIVRKVGSYVTANLRLNFYNRDDYIIPADTLIDLGGGRLYRIPNQVIITGTNLTASALDGSFYTLVPIISEGTGNLYNLLANTSIPISSIQYDFLENLKSAYIDSDSTDGGYSETNEQLYYRAKNSLSARNLTTYRGVKATLFDLFSIKECTPIGLRDPELIRDLISVNISNTSIPNMLTFHRGGMADLYVNFPPYTLVDGYSTGAGRPLGFPYAYTAKDGTVCSIITDPNTLMQKWETDIPNDPLISGLDISLRGSTLETIPSLSNLTVTNLTSNISALHDYVVNTDNEALHSDNLIKQYWPLVVRVSLDIADKRGATIASSLQLKIVEYINTLYSGYYPKTDDIIYLAKSLGITEVHTPIALDAYYLTDTLHIEHIGITTEMVGVNRDPYNSILSPQEADSLKFIPTNSLGQISTRTTTWYTDTNLVQVNLI